MILGLLSVRRLFLVCLTRGLCSDAGDTHLLRRGSAAAGDFPFSVCQYPQFIHIVYNILRFPATRGTIKGENRQSTWIFSSARTGGKSAWQLRGAPVRLSYGGECGILFYIKAGINARFAARQSAGEQDGNRQVGRLYYIYFS